MKNKIFIFASFLVFAMFNFSIYEKELIKANGEVVFLELAPVDPRSLIQGDYMRLRYAIERSAPAGGVARNGYMVISTDENKIAKFERYANQEPLLSNEKLIHFHKMNYGSPSIVPDSFMFQEGQAELYSKAKYGIFKFDNSGNHILLGLADSNRAEIKP